MSKEVNIKDINFIQIMSPEKDTSLSLQAYAIWSRIVFLHGHGKYHNKTALALATGVEITKGVNRCLAELDQLDLIHSNEEGQVFPYKPTPEVWVNCFVRNKDYDEEDENSKPIQEYRTHRTYIRNKDSELSFNMARIWSALLAFSKPFDNQGDTYSFVRQTSKAGLAVICLLSYNTVSSCLESMEQMGLIRVSTRGNSIQVLLCELDQNLIHLFSIKNTNKKEITIDFALFDLQEEAPAPAIEPPVAPTTPAEALAESIATSTAETNAKHTTERARVSRAKKRKEEERLEREALTYPSNSYED